MTRTSSAFLARRSRAFGLLPFVVSALTGACIRPAVTTTSAASPVGAAAEDAARGLVLVHVDGTEIDWNAPWSSGASWKHTLTGLPVAGHRVFVAGWGLRHGHHVEVQKPGAVTRAEARIALFDVDAGLAVLTVDDPAFWSDVQPAVLSPDLPKRNRVKLSHPVGEGMRFESFDGSITGFQPFGPFGFVHMKIGQVDLHSVGMSDAVSIEGQVVALMMASNNGEVYAVGSPTIVDFLAEASHVPYRGYATIGINWQKLTNQALRDSLGLRAQEGGVLIQEVSPGGSSEGVLEPGDAILSVGGTKVDGDGTYLHPSAGRISFQPLLLEGRHPEDTVTVDVLRKGERRTLGLRLKHVTGDEALVPWFGAPTPEHAVAGGLVFQRLSHEYLLTFGKDWESTAPAALLEPYELKSWVSSSERAGVVVLTRVLPVAATLGYEHLQNLVVESVNGVRARTIRDVREAFAHPTGAFHVVTFAPGQVVRRIAIDVAEAKDADRSLRERYHLEQASGL